MPNIPQTVIAMLATTSHRRHLGELLPDFGSRGVIDRFSQLAPKAMFYVDGYQYGGKEFDRKAEMRRSSASLDGLDHVVTLPYLDPGRPAVRSRRARLGRGAERPPVPAAEFAFEQVPFEHPLWILFSSGTTGLPKPICTATAASCWSSSSCKFHMDMRAGDRCSSSPPAGWMMWNFLVSSLLPGVCPVLYDGNPGLARSRRAVAGGRGGRR